MSISDTAKNPCNLPVTFFNLRYYPNLMIICMVKQISVNILPKRYLQDFLEASIPQHEIDFCGWKLKPVPQSATTGLPVEQNAPVVLMLAVSGSSDQGT